MTLQIKKMVYGGDGLARTDKGETVFVPFTLPDELVQIDPREPGTPAGELARVIEPSPDRVAPGCVHFGACGGCQYQHASYPAQVQIKRDILAETLTRAGLHGLPHIVEHASEPWGYRNRIRVRVADHGGILRFGYSRRASNAFLPIRECPIAAPLLWRAATALLTLAEEDATAAAWLRASAEVELACTNDESRLQLTFFLHAHRSAGFAAMCESLRVRLPELVGAGATLDLRHTRASFAPAIAWGSNGLPMLAAGRVYWVARGGFFQVNRTLTDTLVELVAGDRSGALAWDLFAGVGLFTRALRERFAAVTAVEASATAVAELERAAIPRVRTIATPVLPFLRAAAVERDRPELIVLDPPRAGVGLMSARLIGGMRAREVVYVSCDPTTLARDLGAMVDSGYNLAELHLVDLFPQTFHLETVAVLQRA